MAKSTDRSLIPIDFEITLFHVETNKLVTIKADENGVICIPEGYYQIPKIPIDLIDNTSIRGLGDVILGAAPIAN